MPEGDVNKREKSIWVVAGEYSALAFILPSTTFAGYLIGYFLDRQFGTGYLYLIFMLLGIISGFVQIFRFLKRHEK